MGMYHIILSLILFVYPSSSVIYKLDDTEYERMPPLFGLDEYEACLSKDRGLYCLIQLKLFDDRENPLMNLIREYSENAVRHYNHSIIDRGVCVYDTCGIDKSLTGEALTRALGECLNDTIWREYGVQANVSVVYYCDSKSEVDDVTTLDWTVMGVLLAIVLINLTASVYDYAINYSNKEKTVGNKYILSFSMKRNYEWLTSSQPENPKLQSLQFFHCIRVVTNFLMILAHAQLTAASGFTDNTHDLEKTYDWTFYQLLYNGMMIVQVFFFISGFLLAYNFQIYAEKVKVTWLAIPKVMFLRCCRLSPALAVVLAFTATWLRHLGSGPVWKLFVTNSVVADCRTYWWHHLLYINNYMQADKFCIIPTWHIAADTQVCLIGLIVCVATMQRGRCLTLVVLLLVGTAMPALQIWLQDLDGVVLMYPEFYRTLENTTFRNGHVGGHSNLQCYVAGMLCAYFVYRWQEQGVDFSKSKYYSLLFWLTPPAFALVFYTGHVFYADGARASLLARMVYASAHRLALAALAALVTVGMVLKAPSYIRSATEWRAWVVPSRLSYCVYLLHMNLVHILLGTRKQLASVSFFHVAINHLGIVLLTYMIALPFYLMVEAPCNRLVKELLEPMKKDLVVNKSKEKMS